MAAASTLQNVLIAFLPKPPSIRVNIKVTLFYAVSHNEQLNPQSVGVVLVLLFANLQLTFATSSVGAKYYGIKGHYKSFMIILLFKAASGYSPSVSCNPTGYSVFANGSLSNISNFSNSPEFPHGLKAGPYDPGNIPTIAMIV